MTELFSSSIFLLSFVLFFIQLKTQVILCIGYRDLIIRNAEQTTKVVWWWWWWRSDVSFEHYCTHICFHWDCLRLLMKMWCEQMRAIYYCCVGVDAVKKWTISTNKTFFVSSPLFRVNVLWHWAKWRGRREEEGATKWRQTQINYKAVWTILTWYRMNAMTFFK